MKNDFIDNNGTYISNLQSEKTYRFKNIEDVRGINFAEQTVNLLDKYLDTVNFKNVSSNLDKNTVMEFLFTNNKNSLLDSFYSDVKYDDLNKKNKEIQNIEKNIQKKIQISKDELAKKSPEEISEIKLHNKKVSKQEAQLTKLKKEVSEIKEKSRLYYNLALGLCTKNGKVKTEIKINVKNKNELLHDKFIYLLTKFPNLIPEKNNTLKFSKKTIDEKGNTVEILSNKNVIESIAFGITTPCCLSFPASGSKYLYGVLFDPNISMLVIKDKNGSVLADSIITSTNNSIGLWHMDSSKYNKQENKENVLNNGLQKFISEYRQNNNVRIFMAPGESTLLNLGKINPQNTSEINTIIHKDLISNGVSESVIDATVGSGRTDVSSFKYLAYSFEHSESLSKGVKNKLIEFISNNTGWKFIPKDIKVLDKNDIFEISKDEGHGLCNIQFSLSSPKMKHRSNSFDFLNKLSNQNSNSKSPSKSHSFSL